LPASKVAGIIGESVSLMKLNFRSVVSSSKLTLAADDTWIEVASGSPPARTAVSAALCVGFEAADAAADSDDVAGSSVEAAGSDLAHPNTELISRKTNEQIADSFRCVRIKGTRNSEICDDKVSDSQLNALEITDSQSACRSWLFHVMKGRCHNTKPMVSDHRRVVDPILRKQVVRPHRPNAAINRSTSA